jgi:hypothetical protein
MSLSTIGKTSQLFALAAAISPVGFLTIPAPAQAAPACASVEFYQGKFDMWQDDGILATVPGYGTSVANPADYNVPNQTAPTYGNATGGINGFQISIVVSWTKGPGAGGETQYLGQIADNGTSATGTAQLIGSANKVNWSTHGNALKCVPPAAPAPPPAEPPAQAPAQAPPAQPAAPTATVTSDVDLYDVPGGGGNIIGQLRKGQVVTLDTTKNSTCPPQDWCVFSNPKGAAWGFVSNN